MSEANFFLSYCPCCRNIVNFPTVGLIKDYLILSYLILSYLIFLAAVCGSSKIWPSCLADIDAVNSEQPEVGTFHSHTIVYGCFWFILWYIHSWAVRQSQLIRDMHADSGSDSSCTPASRDFHWPMLHMHQLQSQLLLPYKHPVSQDST